MSQLMRTEYLNLSDNTVRGGSTGHGESLNDVENYLLPMDRTRSSSLYGHGVTAGLVVRATSGQAGVTVSTGSALDVAGRTIALPAGGLAVVDPNADPHALDNIPTVPVGADGLVLSTSGLSGALLLTVTWREVLTGNQLTLLHAPWLRLVPASGFDDTGEQVVLARVTLDGAGLVTSLGVGSRHTVALAAERLQLRAAHAESQPQPTVGHLAGAELRARPDGGVNLSLLQIDQDPFPALTVDGDGRIGIGLDDPDAGLDIDHAGSDAPALRLASDDDTWGSGLRMDNVTSHGRKYGMYSGADGRWHFADRTADTDRLTIDDTGRVGIGVAPGADVVLDIARRTRVRQGGASTAGVWLFQDTPQADRAFMGMADDDAVGFWGNTGAQWGLRMNTTTGNVGIGISPHDSIRLFVASAGQAIEASSSTLAIHAFGDQAGIVATGGVMAAQFNGEVRVFGRLRKGDSTFMIDHPLDPANKFLSHSAVESPDMVNVYNGNIVTDDNGEATIVLPDYFEALNRDYRYQLTPVGDVAQVGVVGEVRDCRFTIRADKPGITVSWQVTGIRQDAYANANRLVVEEDKPEAERNRYVYPEAHGQPAENVINSTWKAAN